MHSTITKTCKRPRDTHPYSKTAAYHPAEYIASATIILLPKVSTKIPESIALRAFRLQNDGHHFPPSTALPQELERNGHTSICKCLTNLRPRWCTPHNDSTSTFYWHDSNEKKHTIRPVANDLVLAAVVPCMASLESRRHARHRQILGMPQRYPIEISRFGEIALSDSINHITLPYYAGD